MTCDEAACARPRRSLPVEGELSQPQRRLSSVLSWMLPAIAMAVPVAIMPTAFDPTHVKGALFAVLGAGILAVRAWAWLSGWRFERGIARLAVPMAAVLGVSALSAVLSDHRWATIGELLRLCVCFGLAIVTAEYVAVTGREQRIVSSLLAGGCIVCIYGLIQGAGWDPFEWDVGAETGRILGTFANANYCAGYLVLLLPLAYTRALQNLSRLPQCGKAEAKSAVSIITSATVMVLLAAAMLTCLVWTYTRGAWLGLAFGVCVLAVLTRQRPPRTKGRRSQRIALLSLLGLGVVLAVAVTAPPRQRERLAHVFSVAEKANTTRVLIWEAAFRMWRQHAIWGVGPGTFWVSFPAYQSPLFWKTKTVPTRTMVVTHAHNELLQFLAETGVLGALAWLSLLASIMLPGARASRGGDPGQRRLLAAAIVGGMAGFLVHSLTNVVFPVPSLSALFWLLAGVLFGVSELPGTASAREQKIPRPLRSRFLRAGFGALLVLAVVAVSYGSLRFVRAGYRLGRGESALRADDMRAAQGWLEDAERLSWRDVRVPYRLGHVYDVQGDCRRSLATYRRVEKLAPDYARLHYNLGVVLSRMGDWKQAISEFERELELEDSPRVHFALGFARQHLAADAKDR
jgi:O-antigen ligase